jgi:hypothetical protein
LPATLDEALQKQYGFALKSCALQCMPQIHISEQWRKPLGTHKIFKFQSILTTQLKFNQFNQILTTFIDFSLIQLTKFSRIQFYFKGLGIVNLKPLNKRPIKAD